MDTFLQAHLHGVFLKKISCKTLNAISDLKFRVSYGVIGNQAIPPYQSLALVGPYGQGVFNSSAGSEVYTGMEPLSYVNKNLKWESTKQFDAGFDLGFFKQRITLTADYYSKLTYDLLLSTPIPTTSGFASTLLNVGNISNKGLILICIQLIQQVRCRWSTSVNFSINRNKVTNLNTDNRYFIVECKPVKKR